MKGQPVKSLNSRILALTACLFWSTAFLGVKTGLQFMEPLLFAGMRFTLAGIAVGTVSRRKGYWKQVRSHWKLILMIGFFQTFLLYSFFYLSLDNMRGSTGAIVNGLGPLATAVIAHFFMPGDRLNFRRLFSLCMGVLSVVLITWSGIVPGSTRNETFGIMLMMISLLANASAVVIVARTPDKLDPFVLNSAQLICGGTMLLIAGLLTGGVPAVAPPPLFYAGLFWLVCVTSGGFSIWYYLLKIRKEPVSHVTVWKFVIPFCGSLLSWIFIGNDSPDLISICGMLLTSVSIMLFYSGNSTGKKLSKESV